MKVIYFVCTKDKQAGGRRAGGRREVGSERKDQASKNCYGKNKALGRSARKGQRSTARRPAEFLSPPKTCLGTTSANKLKLA